MFMLCDCYLACLGLGLTFFGGHVGNPGGVYTSVREMAMHVRKWKPCSSHGRAM